MLSFKNFLWLGTVTIFVILAIKWINDGPAPSILPSIKSISQDFNRGKKISKNAQPSRSIASETAPLATTEIIPIIKNSLETLSLANEILIGFQPKTTLSQLYNWKKRYPITLKFYDEAQGIARFAFDHHHYTLAALMQSIQNEKHNLIRFVEPNFALQLSAMPNDFQSVQWYLKNDGKPFRIIEEKNGQAEETIIHKKKDADIASGKIEDAWQLQSGGPAIIAVIDTGVDLWHPELSTTEIVQTSEGQKKLEVHETQIWKNPSEISDNGIDDDNNGYIDDVVGWDFMNQDADPSPDLHFDQWIEDHVEENKKAQFKDELSTTRTSLEIDASHGTHITGLIAALTDNDKGIAGITRPAVKIMPLKIGGIRITEVYDETTGETSEKLSYGLSSVGSVYEVIQYAKKMGAHIINASWGTSGRSNTLEEIIKNSPTMLFVTAAGNASQDLDEDPFYPASFKFNHLITTAACDPEDKLASFSSFGKKSVHIATPGTWIRSLKASPRSLDTPESYANDEYVDLSGTSMSAGILSAIGALVFLELSGQPMPFEMGKIKFALIKTARFSSDLDNFIQSRGTVDLYEALYTIRNNLLPPYEPEIFPEELDTEAFSSTDISDTKLENSGGCAYIDDSNSIPPSFWNFVGPWILFWGFLQFRRKKHFI